MIFAERKLWTRPLTLALTGMTLAWGGDANAQASGPTQGQAMTCGTSLAADAAAVQSAARNAAQEKLSEMAPLYRLMYSDIAYQISVGEADVQGDTARVTGSINVRGKQRFTGRVLAETFQGVVLLSRSGCAWKATSYQQV